MASLGGERTPLKQHERRANWKKAQAANSATSKPIRANKAGGDPPAFESNNFNNWWKSQVKLSEPPSQNKDNHLRRRSQGLDSIGYNSHQT
eukprot:scaffold199852_cov49-Cyclotella_meneghiniana.AAC.1